MILMGYQYGDSKVLDRISANAYRKDIDTGHVFAMARSEEN